MRIKPDFEMSLGVVAQTVLGSKTACGVCNKQLAVGIMVEMEHTKDPKEAEKIARDHLAEDPEYYTNAMDENWGIDEAKDRAKELPQKTAQSVTDIWQQGTKVRFANPEIGEDANYIMIVKEDRGDRVLVRDTGFDTAIQPVSVYSKDELVIVDGYFNEMETRQRWSKPKQASVLVVDDDPEHIRIFKDAFGCDKTIVAQDASAAIEMLRSMKFDNVFLERDFSSQNSTGEDVAWAMQKERLCPQARVIIHSENKRGQKVMARYIGQYHNDVSVVPFRELRKNLEKPRG